MMAEVADSRWRGKLDDCCDY